MPRSSQTADDPHHLRDQPIVWFSELLIAHDKGNYRRATEAQGELARLGWEVNRKSPRKARNREVAR
jgi:hypothetical protein